MSKKKSAPSREAVLVSPERSKLALNASWEIESLCRMLRAIKGNEWGEEGLADRGIILRIEELSCSIMSALGDSMVPDDAVRCAVFGDDPA